MHCSLNRQHWNIDQIHWTTLINLNQDWQLHIEYKIPSLGVSKSLSAVTVLSGVFESSAVYMFYVIIALKHNTYIKMSMVKAFKILSVKNYLFSVYFWQYLQKQSCLHYVTQCSDVEAYSCDRCSVDTQLLEFKLTMLMKTLDSCWIVLSDTQADITAQS